MKRLRGVCHRSVRWLLFVATFLAVLPVGLNAASEYAVRNLGSLGNGAAMTAAINRSGTAVGFITDSQGNQVPVCFDGAANPLGGIGQANGLNDAGSVVGTSFSNGSPYVTEWVQGQAKDLGFKGYATSINNSGEIAGGYQTPNGQLHAFTWDNGTLVDMGTLIGGTWSSAYGVNATGQVAGTSSVTGGRFRAFLSNGGELVSLGTLGGANSHAMALNDAGQVVGNAQTSTGFTHAFLWNGRAMKDLGTLGGSQSYAYGINDAGTVVGYSWTSGNQSMHGFIYSGGLLDLNSLVPSNSGWTITAAYAINFSGEILGTGTLNGHSYAVELLPVDVGKPAMNTTP